MPSSLGNISTATLVQNLSTNTTWYIPMFNYVGSVYISQINSGGSLIGTGVLTYVNANSYAITGTQNFSGGMVVQYNPTGGNWGLEFTNVNLANYTLIVMFVGLSLGNISFTANNPSFSTYTVTTGTAPTCSTFSVGSIYYTRFVFYSTGAIQFSSAAAIQGNDSASGYTTYMLSGTQSSNTGDGTAGATCVYIPTGTGYSTQNFSVSTIGFWNDTTTTVTIDSGTFSCTVFSGAASAPFNGSYAGGSGSDDQHGYLGAGGGSAGPGGPGTSAIASTPSFPSIPGQANVAYNSLGKNGTSGSDSRGGIGGSGQASTGSTGASGLVVITVAGLWQLYVS